MSEDGSAEELAELRKAGSRVGTSPWSSVPSVHPQVGVNSLRILRNPKNG